VSTKTHLTCFPLKSRFHGSMTAAHSSKTLRIATAFGSSAFVAGSGTVAGLVSIVVGLGLISPGAVAG